MDGTSAGSVAGDHCDGEGVAGAGEAVWEIEGEAVVAEGEGVAALYGFVEPDIWEVQDEGVFVEGPGVGREALEVFEVPREDVGGGEGDRPPVLVYWRSDVDDLVDAVAYPSGKSGGFASDGVDGNGKGVGKGVRPD